MTRFDTISVRAFFPSPKVLLLAVPLIAGTAVPSSDGQDVMQFVSHAASADARTFAVSDARTGRIPDPVPVPAKWTAQPIVIDLK